MNKPRLGDISPARIKYSAGDRVIARLSSTLNLEQLKRIRKSINDYAGVELNSLIVDCNSVEIIQIRNLKSIALSGPLYAKPQPSNQTVNFGVSKIVFEDGDVFTISIKWTSSQVREALLTEINRWIGDHQKIIVEWKKLF